MHIIHSIRSRTLGLVTILILVAAACSGATSTTQSQPVETAAPTSSAARAPETPPGSTPIQQDPGPAELALMPDAVGSTDPLETVNHLASVAVRAVEGGVEVTFPAMDNGGLRVQISDTTQQVDIFCDLYSNGDGLTATCSGADRVTGQFLPGEEIPIVGDGSGGYTYVVPLRADSDYVTITLGGTDYMARTVTFADSPGMVQLNPDGSLAAPVVRTLGVARAGDVVVALG